MKTPQSEHLDQVNDPALPAAMLGTPERSSRAEIVSLPDLAGVACPCGTARRAFAHSDDFPGTVHLTEISQNARRHYHQSHTEVYVILECEADACMELDDQRIPLRPLVSVLIPPGVRHRAVGQMRVLIICTPKFDPEDEHFDDE